MKLHQLAEPLEVTQCDLSRSRFSDVKFSGASFTNIDMSGWRIEDVTLAQTTIRNANLTGLEISDCELSAMRIEGVLVSDLMKIWRDSRG